MGRYRPVAATAKFSTWQPAMLARPVRPEQIKERYVKNIQVFDGADNAVYDIFAATDEEFALIFPGDTDVAFIDEVYQKQPSQTLNAAFIAIWKRRVPKRDAMGIHGILFYECEHKKVYYPTRRDEQAVNPDGSKLR